MSFYDAHCHLQDERIVSGLEEVIDCYEKLDVKEVVVNGTCEGDWETVSDLARRYRRVRPSFGLHPWQVAEASGKWRERLAGLWDRHPESGVGEIGLDRWIEGHDLAVQEPVFLWQLQQAYERDRPVSIHCLKAWGRLYELLLEAKLPKRGFLLHSYGGPLEMVKPLASLGGYFSISGYFANPKKEKQRAVFSQVPLDRLLIETDAPDMRGPKDVFTYSISSDESLNHPGNIERVYAFAAELLGLAEDELQETVEANFRRFFC